MWTYLILHMGLDMGGFGWRPIPVVEVWAQSILVAVASVESNLVVVESAWEQQLDTAVSVLQLESNLNDVFANCIVLISQLFTTILIMWGDQKKSTLKYLVAVVDRGDWLVGRDRVGLVVELGTEDLGFLDAMDILADAGLYYACYAYVNWPHAWLYSWLLW